jgi:hypothetical protein
VTAEGSDRRWKGLLVVFHISSSRFLALISFRLGPLLMRFSLQSLSIDLERGDRRTDGDQEGEQDGGCQSGLAPAPAPGVRLPELANPLRSAEVQ